MEKLSTSLGAHQTQHKAKLSEVERERVNEFDLQALRSGDGRRRVVVNPESVAIGKKLYHKVCVHEGRRLSPFQQWAFCAERNMSQQRRQSIATSNVKQILARLSLAPPAGCSFRSMPCARSRHSSSLNPLFARGLWQNESLRLESLSMVQERHLGETEIVLAHCTKSIMWLGDAVRGLREKGANVTHVHVVSKCGYTPNTTSLGAFAGLVVNVTTRHNVGRNDETFVRFLVDRYETLPASLFFLKDTTSQRNKNLRINIGQTGSPTRWPHRQLALHAIYLMLVVSNLQGFTT